MEEDTVISYTEEDVQDIVRELLKYDIFDFLINSDMEDEKEYDFEAGTAMQILTHFSNY